MIAIGVVLVGCGSGADAGRGSLQGSGSSRAAAPEVYGEPGVLVGVITREAIEAELPAWRQAREQATPALDAARALAAVPAGAVVEVALGTWCSDSRREVTRLWRALDLAGGAVPFDVRWIGVDRAKRAPDGLIDGWDVRFVPTFVVRRDGREVGRIVESAPRGIERELLSLLRGESAGTITGRAPDDLAR